MDKYIVETNKLSKTYGGHEALRECSIHVENRSIYSLIGPNGAGKTTLFKVLLGMTKPTYGSAKVMGLDCRMGNTQILRKTGSLIEVPVFYEHLSACENLEIYLEYMRAASDTTDILEAEEALEIVGLRANGTQAIREYSLGMRQRVAIARAIVHKPKLLVLDEPANGLDPLGIAEMRSLFRKLKEQGMTILMSSHVLSEVEKLSNKIGIIVKGEIRCEKTMEEIERDAPDGLEALFVDTVGGISHA